MGELDDSTKAEHLCVLVHGLWGNPSHMESIAKALSAEFAGDRLRVLLAKTNAGYNTYDGIETGAERVCLEIEDEIATVESRGGHITRLSVVGYSLGGLVARYAVGLLHAKGVLDKVECMNFTAFASPFLGVRSPTRGWPAKLWNAIAPRTLSLSGRQLFGTDVFRDTGRPLLAVLADPESIFMAGLARFRRRTLYANVVNDRSAPFYTTFVSKTDPFVDLAKVRVRYAEGYEDVVLDRSNPVAPLPREAWPRRTALEAAEAWVRDLPMLMAMLFLVPVGMAVFLVTSTYQVTASSKRIRLHQGGLAGVDVGKYRVPLWMREMQGAVDSAYEALGAGPGGEEDLLESSDPEGEAEAIGAEAHRILSRERRLSRSQPGEPGGAAPFPTLALAPYQFEAVDALDALGWRKYPVWIHKVRHSHAALIIRWETPRFDEGKVVLRHWVKEEFLI